MQVYRQQAADMGFDESHLFMRFHSLEYATVKEGAGVPLHTPVFMTTVPGEEDVPVDRCALLPSPLLSLPLRFTLFVLLSHRMRSLALCEFDRIVFVFMFV